MMGLPAGFAERGEMLWVLASTIVRLGKSGKREDVKGKR
jgi:hypothetical protein